MKDKIKVGMFVTTDLVKNPPKGISKPPKTPKKLKLKLKGYKK
jgi:hypothetical protein